MNKLIKSVLIAGVALGVVVGLIWKFSGGFVGKQQTVVDESKPHVYYTCSMHPHIHMHEPGKCPICHMTLTKISAEDQPSPRKPLFYRHPMNPAITSPVPAKDGMGMPFTPVYEEGGTSTVEGRGVLTLSPQKLQMIGVRFGRAERGQLGRTIRAYGRVAFDPELYHAQEEYLSAVDLVDLSESGSQPASHERSLRLLKASETRLRLLGLNDEQIQRLKTRRQVDPGLLLGAMESGKVWVYAQVYESDLSFVRVGLNVDVEVPAYPGKTFSGKILAIDSVIDPSTRTARIRSEVNDPLGELKPDLYANVMIHSDLGDGLSVPSGAILNSGSEQHVFVHKGGGRFEPRRVKIGRQMETRVEILAGLAEGEEVVTSGNFLIDSESQLRSGISGMSFYGGKEAAEK